MKKTVKIMLCIITILCAMSIFCAGLAEGDSGALDVGAFFVYGADGDNLWVMTGRAVTVFSAETLEEKANFSVEFDTRQLYPCGDKAYFVIREDGATGIICLDIYGDTAGEWILDEPLNVYQAEQLGDRLYLVVNPNADESYDDQYDFANYGFHMLYSMDMQTGETALVEEIADIGCITAAGDELLCADTVRGTVYVYDALSGEVKNEISATGLLMLDADDSGMAYYVMETWMEDGTPIAGIGYIDVQSGEQGMLCELPSAFSMRIAVAGGRVFTAFFGDEELTWTAVNGDDGDAQVEYCVGEEFKYAVQDGYVWIFTDGHVRILGTELDETVSEFDVSFECVHVAADENAAYVETDAGQIVELNKNGESRVIWEIPETINIRQLEATGGRLVFISTEAEAAYADHVGVTGQLYEYSPEDGSLEEISADGMDRVATIAVKDGAVGAFAEGRLTFISGEDVAGIDTASAVYFTLTEDGRCFALVTAGAEERMLVEIDMNSGAARQICNLGTNAAGLRSGGGRLYVMDAEAQTLVGMAAPDVQHEETALTIIGDNYDPYSPQMEYAVAQFGTLHPEASVSFEKYGVIGDATPLITSLMSGEGRYDILILAEYGMTNTRQYYRAGALMNLGESGEIMAAYAEMIDIAPIFSADGGVFAVPVSVAPIVWQANTELFDYYGLDIPEDGGTWNDFHILGEQVKRLRSEGEDIVLLADTSDPFFLVQYNVNESVNAAPDYTSDIFTENMSLWTDAVNAGIICEAESGADVEPVENALFTTRELAYSSMRDNRYVLPPVYAEYVRTPVVTVSMCVNVNSENAALATEFLASYVAADILKTDEVVWNGRLLKDAAVCERYDHYPDDLYPTAENEQFWEKALSGGVQYCMTGEYMYTQMYEWYPMLISGEISTEEFARMSQEKADMVAEE